MATIAAVAAAAIGAAGTAYSASQSAGAARGLASVRGQTRTIPLTPEQRGLNQYYTRVLASNLSATPPSFSDYVMSGGTARFPLQNLGMTPREAELLGLIDKRGNTIPMVDSATVDETGLTLEQKKALGREQLQSGRPNTPLARANMFENRVGKLTDRMNLDTTGPNRDAHIMDRINRLNDRINRLRGV